MFDSFSVNWIFEDNDDKKINEKGKKRNDYFNKKWLANSKYWIGRSKIVCGKQLVGKNAVN